MSAQKDRILAQLSQLTIDELKEVDREIAIIVNAATPAQQAEKRSALARRINAAGWMTSGPVATGQRCPYCGR